VAVETAAYYTVAEALTNAVKHAQATAAQIQVAASDGVLHVHVRDNGRGGADFSHGSGLIGLKDRAEALGGHLELHSPPGAGTTLEIALPLDNPCAGAAGQCQPRPRRRSKQRFEHPPHNEPSPTDPLQMVTPAGRAISSPAMRSSEAPAP
jgi:hypothetical protein